MAWDRVMDVYGTAKLNFHLSGLDRIEDFDPNDPDNGFEYFVTMAFLDAAITYKDKHPGSKFSICFDSVELEDCSIELHRKEV